MITNFDLLAERLKGVKIGDKEITLDLLKEALSKEDKFEVSVPQAHLLSDSELVSLKEKVKEDNKSGFYVEGKEAGSEMLVKALKKLSNLDFEGKVKKNAQGEIDFEATAKLLNEAFEKSKGIEPNKKINELTESLSNLQKLIEQKEGEIKSWGEKYSGLEKSTKVNEILLSRIPKNITGVTPKQFTTLLQNEGYSIDFTESGEAFATLHGKPLKDQLEKYKPVDSILLDYAKTNNWIKTEGRGSGDDGGGSGSEFKTMNDVFKYMDQNKINPASPAGKKLQEDFEAKTQA